MLSHNMLTVLYRNVLHVISLVRRNSNCCEAQYVTFCSGISTGQCNESHLQKTENHKLVGFFEQHHILISAACCLIVPLSQNGCLAEFWIYQAINWHWQCGVPRIIQSHLSLHSCFLPPDSVAELTCWLRWCALKTLAEPSWYLHCDSGDKEAYCSQNYKIVNIIIKIINYNNTTKLTAQCCIYWNTFHIFLYNI